MVLKEVAVSLLAFSGLFVGYILARIAKEEVKQGKKYLLALKNTVEIISGLAFLYLVWGDLTLLASFAIGLILCLIIRREFFYLGLVVALSLYLEKEGFLLIASLVFIYACMYGCLIDRSKKKTSLVNFSLYLLPFLLVAVEYFISRYIQIILIPAVVLLARYVLFRNGFKRVRQGL